MSESQTIDIMRIMDMIPHRYPILLVDRIVECNNKDWIVGLKNVSANEPCFQGHFPGLPIFPGVLQLEAMAQTAGVLLNTLTKSDVKIAYYLAVDKAKFRRMVVPGDQLRMEIKFLKMRMGMAKVSGRALVDGELACEAEMMFGRDK